MLFADQPASNTVNDVIDWTDKWNADPRLLPARYRAFPGRLVALGFITWGVVTERHHVEFGGHGTGLLALILLAICCGGWIVWSVGTGLAPRHIGERVVIIALCTSGATGTVLTGLNMPSVAIAFPAAATLSIAMRFHVRISAIVFAAFSVIMFCTAAVAQTNLGTAAGYVFVLFGAYGLGLGRYAQIQRANTAEKLLAETRRANNEEAHAAALA